MKADGARFSSKLTCFAADETGATSIEYALIAVCISVAIVGSASSVGGTLKDDLYEKILAAVQTATGSAN